VSRTGHYVFALTFAVLLQAPASGQVQSSGTAALSFEVASIRLSSDKSVRGSEGGPGSKSPTLYRFGRATLLDLICVAWNVDAFQVSSATPLDRKSFDLEARIRESATKEQFRTMLQNLLEERFALKAHLETREFPAYALVVAKSGIKLKEAVPGELAPAPPAVTSGPPWPELPKGRPTVIARVFFADGYQVSRLRMQLEPLSMLSRLLPKEDSLPVVDMTGLNGRYSFNLEYATMAPNAEQTAPEPAPDLFNALKDQLGLDLRPQKLPFNVVVVDAVNPLPTAN